MKKFNKKITTNSCSIVHSKHVWLPSLIKFGPFSVYFTSLKKCFKMALLLTLDPSQRSSLPRLRISRKWREVALDSTPAEKIND
jgi:hypothetical protein